MNLDLYPVGWLHTLASVIAFTVLPHARDFLSIVTQAPGVNDESKSASANNSGIMIDGAAAAENRYVIDGIETTNIIGGLSGKNLLADFVEEVADVDHAQPLLA